MRNRFQLVGVLLSLSSLALPTSAAAQWRYPPIYQPYRYAEAESHLRLNVKPKQADVYVDGFFAGKVQEFDGRLQRLHVTPGQHEIVIYLEGYRSLRQRLYLSPNVTRTLDGSLERLRDGELQEPQPVPSARDREEMDEPDDAYRRPPARGPVGRRAPLDPPVPRRRLPTENPPEARSASRYASLSVRVQPGGAVIRVDGERWDSPSGDDRLIIQVAEGRHLIEVERDGYEPFRREYDVRAGETTPINISLRRR